MDSQKRISELEKENSKQREEAKTLQSENKSLKWQKKVYCDIYRGGPASSSSNFGLKRTAKAVAGTFTLAQHPSCESRQPIQRDMRGRSKRYLKDVVDPQRVEKRKWLSRTQQAPSAPVIRWKIANGDTILVRDSEVLDGPNVDPRLMTGIGNDVCS